MNSHEISKSIFYSPATNGQAENSVALGAGMIKVHSAEKVKDFILVAKECTRNLSPAERDEWFDSHVNLINQLTDEKRN